MWTKRSVGVGLLVSAVLFVGNGIPVVADEHEHTSTAETATSVSSATTTTPAATPSRGGLTDATNPEMLGYTTERIPGGNGVVGDFVVGPGKVELDISPGQSRTVELSVTNRTGVDRLFKLTAEDVTGSRNGEDAVILLGDDTGPYTLKDFARLPPDGVFIKHGQRVRIPVTVTIPPNADPGGRYGSVLVETVSVEREVNAEGAVTKSPLISRIGTLFFIRIPGEAETSGTVTDFHTVPKQTFFSSGPITFAVTYENTGSVHLNPYGEIHMYNIFGEEVGYKVLEPWFTLPQSVRLREFTWDRELLFGRYTIEAAINRGYDDVIDRRTITLWVLPWQYVVTGAGILFIIIFAIRWVATRFEFKRRSD